MRVIIAGSREIDDCEYVKEQIEASGFDITEVVSGKCRGVDKCGELWAKKNNIPVEPFPFVKGMGKAGGPLRNLQMAQYADALILIWDGTSKGSFNMLQNAAKHQLKIFTNV